MASIAIGSIIKSGNRIKIRANLGGQLANILIVGVDRLSAPILSILPIIDIGHFKNRFANTFFFIIFFICKQTYYLQVTLFIGE